ncbi:MAG: DUF4173 domain-containing protein [Cytophagaceae bacterium]
MNTQHLKFSFSILLTLIYNYFFWQESWGINILLFTFLLIGCQFILYKESFRSPKVLIVLTGTLLSAAMVCIHSSDTSKFTFTCSLILLTGFIHQPDLRSVHAAILTALTGIVQASANYTDILKSRKTKQPLFPVILIFLRLAILPLIVLTVFYWIYKFANPLFYKASSEFWDHLGNFMAGIVDNISFSWLLFFISGIFIITGMLFNRNILKFLNSDLSGNDQLRRKGKKIKKIYVHSLIALKNEYRTGLLIILSVNILLVIVNAIDIKWIWFNFNYKEVPDMSALVHEGTYLLIFSIILSMLLLLYFFRGNLNFYKNNHLLKTAAIVWIAQNFILALSVGIRNYHYINHYGIAYKRIGVIVFLILTMFGLITMVVKIRKRYSDYYLFRINSWAVYLMMILISCINWDRTIAAYNLNHPERQNIDILFILNLSDKTLDILYENQSFFDDPVIYQFNRYYHSSGDAKLQLKERIQLFKKKYPQRSWLSWNLAEYNTYQYLINNDIK